MVSGEAGRAYLHRMRGRPGRNGQPDGTRRPTQPIRRFRHGHPERPFRGQCKQPGNRAAESAERRCADTSQFTVGDIGPDREVVLLDQVVWVST
jgi:hypothetical protein